MRTLTFRGQTLRLREARYGNGNLAVEAIDLQGESYAVLSVNMPPYDALPEGVFFLKDWSENAEIAAAFIESGLIEIARDVDARTSGFIAAEAYRFVEDER